MGVHLATDNANFLLGPPRLFTYEEYKKQIKEANLAAHIGTNNTQGIANLSLYDSNSVESKIFCEVIENRYTWMIKNINVMPKKYSEIYAMDLGEFSTYWMLATSKILNKYSQAGIYIFDAPHVKGFIYCGTYIGFRILGELYAKDSQISQIINVTSKSAETSKNVLTSLLASYQFTVRTIPDDNALGQLIRSTIKQNPHYIDDPSLEISNPTIKKKPLGLPKTGRS